MTPDDGWQDHARRELGPKMASSAYVIMIDPGAKVEPEVALETGYAILLGKPILLLAPEGRSVNPGLARIATRIVRLRAGL
ncbi:MAG: hypothetical protein L0227_06875, partial [Chloroflexi bacterium]|nr:hypothetical protein [Chloroflexota bacterium]